MDSQDPGSTGSSSDRLETILAATLEKCLSWLGRDEIDNLVVIDPLEQESVYAHYANSHLAASLVLGSEPGTDLFATGRELVMGLLARWRHDSKLPSFHADFNNMALCLVEERLAELDIDAKLRDEIRTVVLQASDSDHGTINWLPMRAYVNSTRYAWTGDAAWQRAADASIRKVSSATNRDGYVEDRLPRGTSFNLQYDVSTVALLSFLNSRGFSFDLDLPLTALINAISPDGDINYSGRGSNQIFCWGPWLYLLRSSGQHDAYAEALRYLSGHLPTALENANILLNDLPGRNRDMWWDYHYCSVYTAHLLLWLVMTRNLEERPATQVIQASPRYGSDSGVLIERGEDFFVATLSGRREYLAEHGPVVAALWTRSTGMIHKGELGPWLKLFGYRHSGTGTILNHFGLYALDKSSFRPNFVPIHVRLSDTDMVIQFVPKRPRRLMMSIPLLADADGDAISLRVDGEDLPLKDAGSIVTMYGSKRLLQSTPMLARIWEVRIRR